jgi:hypothetical protein
MAILKSLLFGDGALIYLRPLYLLYPEQITLCNSKNQSGRKMYETLRYFAKFGIEYTIRYCL